MAPVSCHKKLKGILMDISTLILISHALIILTLVVDIVTLWKVPV